MFIGEFVHHCCSVVVSQPPRSALVRQTATFDARQLTRHPLAGSPSSPRGVSVPGPLELPCERCNAGILCKRVQEPAATTNKTTITAQNPPAGPFQHIRPLVRIVPMRLADAAGAELH